MEKGESKDQFWAYYNPKFLPSTALHLLYLKVSYHGNNNSFDGIHLNLDYIKLKFILTFEKF